MHRPLGCLGSLHAFILILAIRPPELTSLHDLLPILNANISQESQHYLQALYDSDTPSGPSQQPTWTV